VEPRAEELQNLLEVVSEGKRVWEATFDAIVDPVLIVSKDFRIKRANLAAALAVDLHVRDLIGKRCYEIFAKQDAPCVSCPMLAGRSTASPDRERLQPFPDGRQYMASSFPILGKAGVDLDMTVLQYQDDRAIRKLEEQLLQKEKMAALGLFASGIAHDINNPLAGVLAFAQLAMQDVDPGSQIYQDLKEIEASALRCKKIVENILQFARPTSKDDRVNVDVGKLFEKVLPALLVQWKDSEFKVDIELTGLPAVSAVASKLEQVFTNILANAFQSLKAGGVIRVRGGDNDEFVYLEISDNGEGIDPKHLQKIFDPYFTTKGKSGGTGLGLPICYNIIREHGGKIEVKSRPGKGSLFTVYLPKGEPA